MSAITTDPPIRHMPGDGFIVRLWSSGDGPRERVRTVRRRNYANGVQWAFQYYPMTEVDARLALKRLAAMMCEEEEYRPKWSRLT